MPTPGQRPSPAELAALEHAFASDPASGAYQPLAEAYLANARFMEAMVVAKRGIKSHPDDPRPRLLLARVYVAQKKDEKALEVVSEALQLAPSDPATLRLLATLHLRRGAREEAAAALQRAWQAAPDDPQTAALAAEHGIELKRPVVAPSPPVLARGTVAAAPGPEAPGLGRAAAADGGDTASGAIPGQSAGAPGATPRMPAAIPAPFEEEHEHDVHPARSRTRIVVTGILVLVLAVALAGWGIASGVKKRRAVEIDHLLRQSRDLIDKDSFASYREAARLCERITERDPDAIGGHAYLAYIDSIRWGDLGEGDALRAEAQRHLDAVRKLGRHHSHAYAAQAYLRGYGGDAQGAVAELQQVLKGPEGESPLLRGVLGALELQVGNLDAARDALTWVRQRAPSDVRAAQLLAEQWRRRGAGFEPQANAIYDAILTRLEPDHVPSLLGKAQMLLDAGDPAEALKRIGRIFDLGEKAAPKQVALARQLQARAQSMPRK